MVSFVLDGQMLVEVGKSSTVVVLEVIDVSVDEMVEEDKTVVYEESVIHVEDVVASMLDVDSNVESDVVE